MNEGVDYFQFTNAETKHELVQSIDYDKDYELVYQKYNDDINNLNRKYSSGIKYINKIFVCLLLIMLIVILVVKFNLIDLVK